MKDESHASRLTAELKSAGMTPYGLLKFETNFLPSIIHKNEHIKAVVYGRLDKKIDAVMLVATDKRVLFVDCKPFFKNWDEITYEVVAGVKMSIVGPFAGITLHTRVKDYSLRFVNIQCAKNFATYIEEFIEREETVRLNIKNQKHRLRTSQRAPTNRTSLTMKNKLPQ